MSTYWDIYCRTCDEDCGLRENHNEEGMALLISAAPVIATLPPLAGLSVKSDYGSDLDIEWFRRHAAHDLVPRNEYGVCSEQCNQYLKCPCCGATVHCALRVRHEGDHAAKGEFSR